MAKNKYHVPQQRLPKSKIPQSATLLKDQKDPEDEYFTISYRYYSDSECQITSLNQNTARAFLQDIKTIGRTKRTPYYLKQVGINVIPVYGIGAYKSLLKNLPEDVDLKEHKVQSTSRLFYFLKQNKFCIVAIKMNHIETDKHR
ncbi:MAG: hypothetical protein AAB553_08085 [Patescibacteria group bacterium]